jgi:hypothetical protein
MKRLAARLPFLQDIQNSMGDSPLLCIMVSPPLFNMLSLQLVFRCGSVTIGLFVWWILIVLVSTLRLEVSFDLLFMALETMLVVGCWLLAVSVGVGVGVGFGCTVDEGTWVLRSGIPSMNVTCCALILSLVSLIPQVFSLFPSLVYPRWFEFLLITSLHFRWSNTSFVSKL